MMRKLILALLFGVFILQSCSKEEKDTTKPVIDLNIQDAFPQSCDVIYFDEEFTIRFKLSDDTELGSLSLDIHNNFDHHTHSTEALACNFDEDKEAVNPYIFVEDYSIPASSKEYIFEQKMTISSQNTNGSVDNGDYDFYIRLTDKAGWSVLKGLSVKIESRE